MEGNADLPVKVKKSVAGKNRIPGIMEKGRRKELKIHENRILLNNRSIITYVII
jgi:hypothetical protein